MRATPIASTFLAALCATAFPLIVSSEAVTILETAKANGNFKLLVAALDAAGLAETFDSSSNNFTVFAPTDQAFNGLLATLGVDAAALLARKDLADILTFHVASGSVLSSQLKDAMLIQTLQGAQLLVKILSGVVSIAGAGISAADIRCSNGVIHVIDSVLLPPQRLTLAGGPSGWDEAAWRVQVDGVMGGRSSGAVTVKDKMMLFTGSINLNGGGFSSVRKTNSLDLSGYAGLWVETGTTIYVSGKCALAIHVQLHDSSGTRVAAPVALPISTSQEKSRVFVPMSHFSGRNRWGGPSSGSLDVANVRGLDIYVLYQEGSFMVTLHEISAVKSAADAPAAPSAPAVAALAKAGAMTELLGSTINSGGFVYNKEYQDICQAIYASTTRSILAAPGMTEAARGAACAGLTKAATLGSNLDGQAWILRRAFDAMLADEAGRSRNSEMSYPEFVRGSWLPATGAASQQAAAACAWMRSGDAAVTTNTQPAPTPSTPSGMDKKEDAMTEVSRYFHGPFAGMGISGHNDFGNVQVSNPAQCAMACRQNAECRSFDYGARGKVLGECWLSRADRQSAGHAYSSWSLYDYYEMKLEDEMVAGASKNNLRSNGMTAQAPNESESSNSMVLIVAAIGGAVCLILLAVIVKLLLARGAAPKVVTDKAMASDQRDVVMGRPVKDQAGTLGVVVPLDECCNNPGSEDRSVFRRQTSPQGQAVVVQDM